MITIDGIDDVKRVLDRIAPKHAKNLMRATIQGVASEGAKVAKKHAPKRTGNLKKSIKAKRKKSPPDSPVSEIIVKPDGFYWKFVEYGTKTMPEHPFIRPASDHLNANFMKIVEQQFAKKLESKLKREARKSKK